MKADWWGPTNSSSTSPPKFSIFSLWARCRSELLKDLPVIHLRDQLKESWVDLVLTALHFERSSIQLCIHHVWWFPEKKWALNPIHPGLKLSTTFSISSSLTCRINPSYGSSVRTLSNFAVHIARSDLSQDVLEMRNCSNLDASLPINHAAVIIFNGTQNQIFRALLSAHIVLVFLSPPQDLGFLSHKRLLRVKHGIKFI